MGAEGSGPVARGAALLTENQQLRRQLAETKLLVTQVTTEWARLKEWRAVATCYERTANSFIGILRVAAPSIRTMLTGHTFDTPASEDPLSMKKTLHKI